MSEKCADFAALEFAGDATGNAAKSAVDGVLYSVVDGDVSADTSVDSDALADAPVDADVPVCTPVDAAAPVCAAADDIAPFSADAADTVVPDAVFGIIKDVAPNAASPDSSLAPTSREPLSAFPSDCSAAKASGTIIWVESKIARTLARILYIIIATFTGLNMRDFCSPRFTSAIEIFDFDIAL